MLTTRFTKLVGCTVPIQQAGMGAAAPPELAAAVSEAGAFGMLGTARGGLNATTLAGMLERTRALTTRPFGVNFIMRPGSVAARSPRPFIEQAATASRAVEFFYTDPDPEFVRIVHDKGALAFWQVGSREEALAAAEAEALIAARAQDSVYTRTFHVGWPDAPHRVLRSSIDAAEAFQGEVIGKVVNLDGAQPSVPRFSVTVADRTATGEVGAMALYAGESVSAVKRVLPAREVVREIAEEAEELLCRPR